MDREESNVWTSHFLPPLKGPTLCPLTNGTHRWTNSLDPRQDPSLSIMSQNGASSERNTHAPKKREKEEGARTSSSRPHPFRESAALFLPIISVRAYSSVVCDE